MKTNYQLQNMAAASQDQAFVDESARIAVPYTAIVGRASIPDLANDFRASLGIERIPVQQIMLLQNEFGPNGEPVYAALNDTRGLMRFVGSWTASAGGFGNQVYSSTAGDYLEITFYGTGLNLLAYVDSAARVWTYTVDGGSPVTGSYPASGNAILGSRNYAPNQILPVTTTALGLHTIKIACVNTTIVLFGFEILNANASGYVNINPGSGYYRGKKIKNTAADSIAYNTGVTGAKGGRIVRYFTDTDTVAQAFQAVDASAVFYPSAVSHVNEEVARKYIPREFGCGRNDLKDWSLASSADNYAFTLEDGTTTLVGDSSLITYNATAGVEAALINVDNKSMRFTFVGCGLDILCFDDAGGTDATWTMSIDGGTPFSYPSASFRTPKCLKIASGLSYGSHTFKLSRNSITAFAVGVVAFIVYQPKKPTLPLGAIEVADYNVMADFAANTTAGVNTIATGVLRKVPAREMVYVGTWAVEFTPANHCAGIAIRSATNGSTASYTFFGTGFEFRSENAGVNVNTKFSIDGASNFTVSNGSYWTGALTTSYYGGWASFTASTGVLLGSGSTAMGAGLRISGLNLGMHTVTILENTSAELCTLDCLDIITPIHSHKSNLYADLQNTLPVGSQSLMDSRSVSPQPSSLSAPKAWAQALVDVGGAPPTTNSTAFIPLPQASVTLKTQGGPVAISYAVDHYNNTAGNPCMFQVYVNGVAVGVLKTANQGASWALTVTDYMIVPLTAGTHKIDTYWKVGAGSIGYFRYCTMTAKEL
jgi:hypothetical protein